MQIACQILNFVFISEIKAFFVVIFGESVMLGGR